ncbi:MAG TPA: prenyltransferase [Steroidobacteraceae bacterium]|nr:prenyltransferase [Steroidobacteraceae bacterium]
MSPRALFAPASAGPPGSALVRPWLRIVRLVRYRFFLYAGLMPYLLGAAWAAALLRRFDATLFWAALGGVALAVVGVEAFNEYFDARLGSDRVFNVEDAPPMSAAVLWLGIGAFATALAVGAYLTARVGWPVLAFALLGGLAAVFYAAPPLRWAYRGLGELVIGLSYGPWLVLGSAYLQTRRLSAAELLASLVPGLLIMSLAVVNAIPDYHQDRLVGKRNLVVRLGRRRAVGLYLGLAAAGLIVVVAGVAASIFPPQCLAALLALPLWVLSARRAARSYEQPRRFAPAIRSIVLYYLLAVSLFIAGILTHRWHL